MIVVSDTSPLTALLTVGEAELLPKLFHEVIIPEAVRGELLRSHPPGWLRVEGVKDTAQVSDSHMVFNGCDLLICHRS